jgi:cyclase
MILRCVMTLFFENYTPRPNHKLAVLLVCSVASELFASPACAQAAQDFSNVEIKLQKLADNFYVLNDSDEAGGSVSVLTGPDGVLMVDTQLAPLSPKVEAAIRRLSQQPIRYVINTHVHIDQTDGNEYFGRLGATIIAREQVRYRLMHPITVPGRVQRVPAPTAALPKLIYADHMTLYFNGEKIQVIAMPSAHTDGDTMIYLPGVDILVAGDVLRPATYPSINRPDGGTLRGMLEALGYIIGRAGPDTRIITSHGPPVDRAVAIAQRDLILTVRDRVAALIAQGKSEAEVVAARITADLDAHALQSHTSAERFVSDVYGELKVAH